MCLVSPLLTHLIVSLLLIRALDLEDLKFFFFKLIYFLFCIYVNVSEYVYVYHMSADACGGQKRALGILDGQVLLTAESFTQCQHTHTPFSALSIKSYIAFF